MNDFPGADETPVDFVVDHDTRSVDADLCRRILHVVFDEERVDVKHITVILTDHATVRDLNRSYLDHDYDTDVLAFRYSEQDEPVEGEVYIDLDTAHERHEEFDASFEEETMRYVVHGVLHLVGHTDETPAGKQTMRRLEDRYLRSAGML